MNTTNDIPGWALEAARQLNPGTFVAEEQVARLIAKLAPPPSAEVEQSPRFQRLLRVNMRREQELAACQQERDRLREAGNRLAEACDNLANIANLNIADEALAHWRTIDGS